jgi:hypothetical protein
MRVLSKDDVDKASDGRKLYGFNKYLKMVSGRKRACINGESRTLRQPARRESYF